MYRTGSWKYQGVLLGGDALILLGAFSVGMEYWWWKAGPEAGDFFPSVFLSLVPYLLALAAFDLYEIQTNYRTHKALTMTLVVGAVLVAGLRSEERRVGKECRLGGGACGEKKRA